MLERAINPKANGRTLFFSYTTDITLTTQRAAAVAGDKELSSKHLVYRADPRFFWNKNLLAPFLGALGRLCLGVWCVFVYVCVCVCVCVCLGVCLGWWWCIVYEYIVPHIAYTAVAHTTLPLCTPPPPKKHNTPTQTPHPPHQHTAQKNMEPFCLPIMQGFFEQLPNITFRVLGSEKTATFTLIARRGVARAGTRYWRRGADLQGNVANFVESEQLLTFAEHNVVSSYVQIRGSLPILWSQAPNIKYKPPTYIAPEQVSEPAFTTHVTRLLEDYKVWVVE